MRRGTVSSSSLHGTNIGYSGLLPLSPFPPSFHSPLSFFPSSLLPSPTRAYGEMKEVRTTMPASANSLATSLILRMFSSRSSGVNPRFLFKPVAGEGGKG